MECHAEFVWIMVLNINHYIVNNYTSLKGNSMYSIYVCVLGLLEILIFVEIRHKILFLIKY